MVPPRAPLLGNASVTRLRPAKPTSAGGTEVAQGRDTLAPERHGPGGPTGLQNRCGVAAPRSVGSTPAPLRQATTVRPSEAAEQLPFWKRLPGRQALGECAKAALGRNQPEVAAVGVHDVRT